jgi:uncharacterized membrane protein SpoIIM required for sporulation
MARRFHPVWYYHRVRADKFVESRRPAWERLEGLVKQAQAGGLPSLAPEELDLLGRLYRKATSDLAYARTQVDDPSVLEYLNLLAMRAHAQVYRPHRRAGSLGRFLTREFPAVFRQTLTFTLIATAVFLAAAGYAFVVTRADPALGEQFLPAGLREGARALREGTGPPDEGWEALVRALGPGFSVVIFVNNITVGFLAFAGGVVFGLGTLAALMQNGMLLGALSAFVVGTPSERAYWSLILPHGSLELPAIFLCGGAGLLLGWSLISPGDLPRLVSLRRRAGVAVRLVAGAAVVLVVAGLIEGIITPADLPYSIKFGVAGVAFATLCGYLGFAGRGSTYGVE